MAILDVIQGGFNKELVGMIKHENRKIIQTEVALNENYKERD